MLWFTPKNQSFRYMSHLDHLVCERNISKMQVMSMYQHKEVACRMHVSLSIVDVRYMAPPRAALVAPQGVTSPPQPSPPRRCCRCRHGWWHVTHVDRQERSASVMCNFRVLLCGHDPDFFVMFPSHTMRSR